MQIIIKDKKQMVDLIKVYNYPLSKFLKKSKDRYLMKVNIEASIKISLYKIKSFNDVIEVHLRVILSYDIISKLMKKLKVLTNI